MNSVAKLLSKHPIGILFYLLYTLLCIRIPFLLLDKNSAIHGPDGGLLSVFLIFFAIMLVLVNLISAGIDKQSLRYYITMITLCTIQAFIVWTFY
jgi:hypothetical protein